MTVDPRLIKILDLLAEEYPWEQKSRIPLAKRILDAVDPAPDLDRAEALIEKAGELRLDDKRLTDLETQVAALIKAVNDHALFGGHMAKGVVYPGPPPYAPPPIRPPYPFNPQPTIWSGGSIETNTPNTYVTYNKGNPNTGTGEVTA